MSAHSDSGRWSCPCLVALLVPWERNRCFWHPAGDQVGDKIRKVIRVDGLVGDRQLGLCPPVMPGVLPPFEFGHPRGVHVVTGYAAHKEIIPEQAAGPPEVGCASGIGDEAQVLRIDSEACFFLQFSCRRAG